MGWGNDIASAVSAAEKAGIDLKAAKGLDKYCKTIEKINKMVDVLAPQYKKVLTYISGPTKKDAKMAKEFFEEKDELAKLWNTIKDDYYAYTTIMENIQKSSSDKKQKVLLDDIMVAMRFATGILKDNELVKSSDKLISNLAKNIEKEKSDLLKEKQKQLKDEEDKYAEVVEKDMEELYIRA